MKSKKQNNLKRNVVVIIAAFIFTFVCGMALAKSNSTQQSSSDEISNIDDNDNAPPESDIVGDNQDDFVFDETLLTTGNLAKQRNDSLSNKIQNAKRITGNKWNICGDYSIKESRWVWGKNLRISLYDGNDSKNKSGNVLGFAYNNHAHDPSPERKYCRIWLNKNKIKKMNNSFTYICGVMVHEGGHLDGKNHSKNPNDVMYKYVTAKSIYKKCF